MHDPVQPGAHQEHQVRFAQCRAARRANGERIVVRHGAFAHWRVQERQLGALDELADVVLGARPRHAFADHHERPFGGFQGLERGFHRIRVGLRARRFGHPGRLDHVVFFALGADDVVRKVEIDRAGAAVQRVANGLIDVVRDAMRVLDGVRVLAVGGGQFHLAFLLEAAHAVLVDGRRAADQDHRPAVLLGIGEPGEGVDDAGAGDG